MGLAYRAALHRDAWPMTAGEQRAGGQRSQRFDCRRSWLGETGGCAEALWEMMQKVDKHQLRGRLL